MPRDDRRHLPHGAPDGSVIFITWNLKGALPKLVLDRIELSRRAFDSSKEILAGNPEQARAEDAREIFRISEEFLDQARTGPLYLQNPSCAEIVTRIILEGANTWYDLYAFAVMANHVHLLLSPKVDLERITCGIKSKTARQINEILNRKGQPFWQDESFDHRSRDAAKRVKALTYIENNPVKAGLCPSPENWPWSSASMRIEWPKGKALRL